MRFFCFSLTLLSESAALWADQHRTSVLHPKTRQGDGKRAINNHLKDVERRRMDINPRGLQTSLLTISPHHERSHRISRPLLGSWPWLFPLPEVLFPSIWQWCLPVLQGSAWMLPPWKGQSVAPRPTALNAICSLIFANLRTHTL